MELFDGFKLISLSGGSSIADFDKEWAQLWPLEAVLGKLLPGAETAIHDSVSEFYPRSCFECGRFFVAYA